MSKSLYKTLEVSENASIKDIKKSYRTLAKKYHPDINKSKEAEEKFKEINGAYEVLGDENKKRQYDQQGDSMFGGQNFHDFASSQQGGGVDLNDILREMFSGGRGGGNMGGGFPFGDMHSMEGNFAPNLDVNANFKISFESSILGNKEQISYNNDSFSIKIPKGIKDGQKIRAKGKGKSANGAKGDLIITLNVDSSNIYERDGDDLHMFFDVSLKNALFGGTVNISTLQKDIKLKIPQNTKQAQQFRVKGLGAFNAKTKEYGYLYLKANIKLPNTSLLDNSFLKILKDKLPD
jgi:curved DNA-binding protein